jgi:hypothetical protein
LYEVYHSIDSSELIDWSNDVNGGWGGSSSSSNIMVPAYVSAMGGAGSSGSSSSSSSLINTAAASYSFDSYEDSLLIGATPAALAGAASDGLEQCEEQQPELPPLPPAPAEWARSSSSSSMLLRWVGWCCSEVTDSSAEQPSAGCHLLLEALLSVGYAVDAAVVVDVDETEQ